MANKGIPSTGTKLKRASVYVGQVTKINAAGGFTIPIRNMTSLESAQKEKEPVKQPEGSDIVVEIIYHHALHAANVLAWYSGEKAIYTFEWPNDDLGVAVDPTTVTCFCSKFEPGESAIDGHRTATITLTPTGVAPLYTAPTP